MLEQKIPLNQDQVGASHYITMRQYGNKNAKKIYIQASLHADELPGALMIYYLEKLLKPLEEQGKIIGNITIVPMANPFGSHQFHNGYHLGREDLGGSGNFNRNHFNFTAEIAQNIAGKLTQDANENRQIIINEFYEILNQKMAEPACDMMAYYRLVLAGLAFDADIVLDCHCDSVARPYFYTSHHNYPSLEDLGRFMGAEAILLSDVSGGNSFDEAFSRPWWELKAQFADKFPINFQCESATLEYRSLLDVDAKTAQSDAENMLNFLIHRGFISAPMPKYPKLLCQATDLRAHVIEYAPMMGIIIYEKNIGQMVAKGDILAQIINPINGESAPVKASISGYYYAHTQSHWVRRGHDVASIAGTEIIKKDNDYLLSD